MEYSTVEEGTYTVCTTTNTSVLPGTYYVRYKADDTHAAGMNARVVVPIYS